jgi:hypothetical protein
MNKSGFSITFPNLGAGIWTLCDSSGMNNLDIGEVNIGNGVYLQAFQDKAITFISSATPFYSSGGSSQTRTIRYAFYSMGSWGS